jgi:hypothetical protein
MKINFIRYNSDQLVRIGLLKILVAVLEPQRMSISSSAIKQKLISLIFNNDNGGKFVENLIRTAGCISWSFSINKNNVGLILDWGKLYGFVGSGNQITEKGLLLRYLMDDNSILSIRNKSLTHNPFYITFEQKIYFLYNQFEIDTTLIFLLHRLSEILEGEAINGIFADRLTCLSLYDTYKVISGVRISSGNLLLLKNLKELIGRMAVELDMVAEIPIQPSKLPRYKGVPRQKVEQRNRKRTKTSDHEAIPRFELLTDLALLTKKFTEEEHKDEDKSRKAWRYWVTPLLKNFAERLPAKPDSDFCWNHFAQAASILSSKQTKRLSIETDALSIAQRAFEAYSLVKRRFGHTPIESVGIIAMIRSLAVSEILEVRDIYELFLKFKMNDLFSEYVRFAAGNDLDKMFIDIKPEFIEEAKGYYGE